MDVQVHHFPAECVQILATIMFDGIFNIRTGLQEIWYLVLLFLQERELFLYPKQIVPFTNCFTIANFNHNNIRHYFECVCEKLLPCASRFVFVQIINTNIQSPTNIVTHNTSIISCCFRYRLIVELNNNVHCQFILCHHKEQIRLSLHC